MKRINIKSYFFLIVVLLSFGAKAQERTTNTLYFMENTAFRQIFNPAFQPKSNVVVGLPVFGYTQFGAGNNSLTLKDVLYKDKNENYMFFFHPNGDKERFYNALRSSTKIGADFRVNLLTIGLRTTETEYWTFSSSIRGVGDLTLPQSLMGLVLFGTKEQSKNNHFNLNRLSADAMVFSDFSLGYSKILGEKWTVGAKASFLVGHVHASYRNKLTLDADINQWHVKGSGVMNSNVPGLSLDENFKADFNLNQDEIASSFANGFGGGLELGAVYKPIEALSLSVALNDLGFIRWKKKNALNMAYSTDYVFDGIDFNDFEGRDKMLKKIEKEFKDNSEFTRTNDAYSSFLSPKLNLGAEYAFFDNALSLGLLSKTFLYNRSLYEELTFSANARANNLVDFSLSYSLLNGRGSNIGAGIGVRTGFIQWVVAADYVPLHFAHYSNAKGSDLTVPYNSKGMNLSLGINLVFGNKQDKDKDGVKNKFDLCPDTPRGVKVDKDGCPLDGDGDGVPDYLDKCPDTPAEAKGFVGEDGCPLDSDGDGVPDYLDKCPGTPEEAKGQIDENGCPFDADGDGVPDYLDKCPDTPAEAKGLVNEQGCPLDTDGDGVPDYLDKCPGTPEEARGQIDENGCSRDSDGDGVPDYLDKCPGTAKEAKGFVDERGCPQDKDGDGIPDYLDACPDVKGVKANNGCPEVKAEVKRLFRQALQGIQFETGKSVIKKTSYPLLDKIVDAMLNNPEYKIEIQGHTDNTGSAALNLRLSDERAASVHQYLIGKGVDPSQITSKGYGISRPIADNKTAAGRAKNRRVEFVVSFEKVVTE